MYMPEIGRWGVVDPLAEKYSSMTPYSYAGNNPVIFVDYDGRDYGVHFNAETNTVTIKATYYAKAEDQASAQQAAKDWNDRSGINSFVVGKGENAISYTVNYDISVVEVEIDSKLGETASLNAALGRDASGEGNIYRVVPDSELESNTNGATIGGNYVRVKDSQKSSPTGAHEIGHSLGFVHDSEGLMTSAASDSKKSNSITKKGISEMIKYPLSGKVNSETNTNGVPVKAGRGTVTNNTQLTNKQLQKGKIK